MPTAKPRISITLDDTDLASLDRFCEAFGLVRATVVSQLVSTVAPELNRAAHLVEIVASAPDRIRQGMVNEFGAATNAALADMVKVHGSVDDMMSKLQGQLQLEPKRAGRRGGSAGSRPAASSRPKTPTY